jgi:hypothetical protein
MKIRSELKKEYADLMNRLQRNSKFIVVTSGSDSIEDLMEGISEKRNEPQKVFDGLAYSEIVNKLLNLSEEIEKVNIAIEEANKEGHNLLYKEATLKSKLALVQFLLDNERSVPDMEKDYEIDYSTRDEHDYKRNLIYKHYFSMTGGEFNGVSLADTKQTLTEELEKVRDELTVFNSRPIIDYKKSDNL